MVLVHERAILSSTRFFFEKFNCCKIRSYLLGDLKLISKSWRSSRIFVVKSPGNEKIQVFIEEGKVFKRGVYYIDNRHPKTAHITLAMRGEGRCLSIMSCVSLATIWGFRDISREQSARRKTCVIVIINLIYCWRHESWCSLQFHQNGDVATAWRVVYHLVMNGYYESQGCISCGILVSGIRARGVSSEHMENMEMFSCSPT